jgi:hypothetical protein
LCSIRWQAKSDPICFERFRVDELPTLCVLEGRTVKARLVSPRGCGDIEQLLAPWLR